MKSGFEELDRVFSIFIRTTFADWKGEALCYTCPARGRWQDFDCGHFRKRQYLTTRWERDNARPQCHHCNRHKEGEVETFEAELREELGDERVNEIIELSHKQFEKDDAWVTDQIIHYKTMIRGHI